jgi:hypothetical protein
VSGAMDLGPVRDPSGRAVAGRASYLILHNTSEVVTADPEGRHVLRYPRGAVVFREGACSRWGRGPSCCGATPTRGR